MSGRNSPGENEGKAAGVTGEAAALEKASELEKLIDVKDSETAEAVEQHDQGGQLEETEQLDPSKGP